MQFGWFGLHWFWIGLGFAVVMLMLLLATNFFRSNPAISRWRDPVWLAWLAPVGYMLHQTEEYGIDLQGKHFAFPDQVCTTMGQHPYPDCTFPPLFFEAVNIPAIWIGGLLCALLSRLHPLIGLSLYGVYFVNALTHVSVFLITGKYNPGALTAILVLIPLSLWVAYAMSSNDLIRKSGVLTIFLVGVVVNGLLGLCIIGFAHGVITGNILIATQLANPVWLVLLPWLKEQYDQWSAVSSRS